METYLSAQALAFLWAVLLGGALGMAYDFFRVARILRRRDRFLLVLLEDLLFSLLAALATAYCFAKTNYGQVRLFLLIGEGLGFMLWFHTIGVLIGYLARLVARFLEMLRRLFKGFFALFSSFLRKIMNFLKKTFIFFREWYRIKMLKFAERRRKREQKPLKAQAHQKNEPRR